MDFIMEIATINNYWGKRFHISYWIEFSQLDWCCCNTGG